MLFRFEFRGDFQAKVAAFAELQQQFDSLLVQFPRAANPERKLEIVAQCRALTEAARSVVEMAADDLDRHNQAAAALVERGG